MDIEIRLLKNAIALAEYGNFARAANSVHLSQPSLSRGIQELESRLGVQLFSRNRTGVEPTAAGILLLDQAMEVISRTDDLVREMELLRGLQKGELDIAAGIYPGPMFTDLAIGRLIRAHPAARVSIAYNHTREIIPNLAKRKYDLAVVYLDPRGMDRQFHMISLKPHYIYFVARSGHPLYSRKKITLNDILCYPLSTTSGIPPALVKRFRVAKPKQSDGDSHVLKSIPSVGCESLSMMKTIILESDTVGLLPLNVALPEIELGTLAVLPFVEPWMAPSFGIVRLAHRSLSPLAERFSELVIEADSELFEMEREMAPKLVNKSKAVNTKRNTKA